MTSDSSLTQSSVIGSYIAFTSLKNLCSLLSMQHTRRFMCKFTFDQGKRFNVSDVF